jgi:hypothetical protein
MHEILPVSARNAFADSGVLARDLVAASRPSLPGLCGSHSILAILVARLISVRWATVTARQDAQYDKCSHPHSSRHDPPPRPARRESACARAPIGPDPPAADQTEPIHNAESTSHAETRVCTLSARRRASRSKRSRLRSLMNPQVSQSFSRTSSGHSVSGGMVRM